MEIGAASRIEADFGTLYFNDYDDTHAQGGFLHLTAVTGGDNADVRSPVDNRPQRDGGIVHAAYRGPRHFTLEGALVSPDAGNRRALEDLVRGVTNSMLRSDGRYIWTPPGSGDRFITCRLGGPVEFTGAGVSGSSSQAIGETGLIKSFVIPLVSEDPIAYGLSQVQTDIDDGASATVPNGGNAESWPVLQVHGPLDSFIVTNETNGSQEVAYAGSILAGHYAEIIAFRESVFEDGSGANLLGGVDFENTDFWTLVPGDNTVSFLATGDGGSAFVRVLSNDGWV